MTRTEREYVDSLFGDAASLAEYKTREIENRTVSEEALHVLSLGDYIDYATKQGESLKYQLVVIDELHGLQTDAGRSAYRSIQRCIKRLEEFVLEVEA